MARPGRPMAKYPARAKLPCLKKQNRLQRHRKNVTRAARRKHDNARTAKHARRKMQQRAEVPPTFQMSHRRNVGSTSADNVHAQVLLQGGTGEGDTTDNTKTRSGLDSTYANQKCLTENIQMPVPQS